MIFPQFVIYVLIYDYLKFRKDPSITSQEITNYIRVALAVALSVVKRTTYIRIYQLPPLLIALQPIDLIKLFSIRSIHLYQVNVTLHFYE